MISKAEQKRLDQNLIRIWAVAYSARHYGRPDLAEQLEGFAKELEDGALTWTDEVDD